MKCHEFKADSDWTICHNVTSRYVSIVTFKEPHCIEGRGIVNLATDCLAFESESHSACLNAALDAARNDPRESTFRAHETWIIKEPARLAGKRDNKRIN